MTSRTLLIGLALVLAPLAASAQGGRAGAGDRAPRPGARDRMNTLAASAQAPAQRERAGVFDGTLRHGGRERSYSLHVPRSYLRRRGDVPLLMVLHGGGGSARRAQRYGFDRLAEREGILIVYPQAVEGHWNDGRGVQRYTSMRENVDDVGFLTRVLNVVSAQYRVDARRLHLSGVSNGGMMTHRLSFALSNRLASVAPVIANIPLNLLGNETPSSPLPIMIINGTEDPLVPYEGGFVHLGRRTMGQVISAADTVRFWTGNNRSAARPRVQAIDTQDDETRVRVFTYAGGAGAAPVVFYSVIGGGHTIPGGTQYLPEAIIGRTSQEFDAVETIWRFFVDNPRS